MYIQGMPINDGCGLRAAVTLSAVEILRIHSVFAENALELGTACQRLGGVVAHNSL
jgi:hypothetical protein